MSRAVRHNDMPGSDKYASDSYEETVSRLEERVAALERRHDWGIQRRWSQFLGWCKQQKARSQERREYMYYTRREGWIIATLLVTVLILLIVASVMIPTYTMLLHSRRVLKNVKTQAALEKLQKQFNDLRADQNDLREDFEILIDEDDYDEKKQEPKQHEEPYLLFRDQVTAQLKQTIPEVLTKLKRVMPEIRDWLERLGESDIQRILEEHPETAEEFDIRNHV